MKSMINIFAALVVATATVFSASAEQNTESTIVPAGNLKFVKAAFEEAKKNKPRLREFLTGFPKGGDIHNHMVGAIYAESYIAWAAEDGLCISVPDFALVPPKKNEACDISAVAATRSGEMREKLINSLSMRNFQPSSGWSGHDQFFSTFNKMYYANFYQYDKGPLRTGDMLAELAERAASQYLGYLELLHTMELGSILSMVPPNLGEKEKTIEGLYKVLMAGPFGKALPQLVSNARGHLDRASNRKNQLLQCQENNSSCDVKILFLHQVIREFSLPQVFAQLILGAELSKTDHRMVGLNMVAPEDGVLAMADYDKHMQMIGFLWKKEKEAGGELNITLHAGELVLGLVPPEALKSHIRSAIEVAHAKRIGHAIAIAHEDNVGQLLQIMADNEIMVEINLSSNDDILGVVGKDHPYALYKASGVPMALSSDDEGVSRIDITNEYMRAVMEQGASYEDLLSLSRNSLIYSFISGESLWKQGVINNSDCAQDLKFGPSSPSSKCLIFLDSSAKAAMQWKLELKINQFHDSIK